MAPRGQEPDPADQRELAAARLALVEVLSDGEWAPEPTVLTQLDQDRVVLRAPSGRSRAS